MLSIDANWSIHKNLDERQYGRLTIDDFGCANLYLPFAFAKQFEEMTELSKYDYLYGLTNNSQFVVMEQCSEKSSNLGRDCNITSERVFIFNDCNMFNKEYVDVFISYDRLGVWLSKSDVAIATEQDDNAGLKRIYANAAHSVIWEGKLEHFDVRFLCDLNVKVELQNLFSIKSNFFMQLVLRSPINFKDFYEISNILNIVSQINILLNICIGEDVYTNSIRFKGDGADVSVYEYGMIGECHNRKDHVNQSMDFPLLMGSFSELLKNWLQNYENLEGTARIIKSHFLDTGRRKRLIDIPTFIKDVCVGIESYSRNMREIKIEDDLEVYQDRYDRIMNSIKHEPEASKWLKQKLKYANEASLRKRIKIIFSELSGEFPSVVSFLQLDDKKKSDILIDRIVKTRNFYTHYDLSSDDIIYNDKEAYTVSVILIEILRIILLRVCGVPAKIIDSFVKENQILIKACGDMGFIDLMPPMISSMFMGIGDNIFWFRTSYFSDEMTIYRSVLEELKKRDITTFITVDNSYEKTGYCYYDEDKIIKRYFVKLDEKFQGKEVQKLHSIIDKNIKNGNKIAIWLSDVYINTKIIEEIRNSYGNN